MNINNFLPQVATIRRQLHSYPELSFKEYKTTQLIEETLKNWGVEFHRFKNLDTGGYCTIGRGRTIAFRADIDALPIEENQNHKTISCHPGIMHACGHDFHTAIGLGLAKYFSSKAEQLHKRLMVVFQPGEEAAPGGAEKVLEEKIWNETEAILAVHVTPDLAVGKFILLNGAVQASSTSIYVEISGPGGHTSKPSESVDLINVSALFVTQLQNYLHQKTDPQETVVLVFGSIHGGSTHNIIPQKIQLRGTLRTLNNSVLNDTISSMRLFSSDFEKIYNIKIKLQFPTNCPATINDPLLFKKFADFIKDVGKDDNLITDRMPSMGADDFAFYTQKFPGLYLIAGGAGKGTLHSGDLELNEALLEPVLENLVGFISLL
ncbi:MAG TPA: amidohydrolase [Calditrichaeota bacterium]|nr:amidohydrolase [Calditrichota bacterium]